MPEELKQALDNARKDSGRSLNSEIVARLQASINADEFGRGAESGDPYAAALAATETIRTATRVLDKALVKIGVDEGRIEIQDKGAGYRISPVDDKELQLLQLLRQASPELQEAVFRLLDAPREE